MAPFQAVHLYRLALGRPSWENEEQADKGNESHMWLSFPGEVTAGPVRPDTWREERPAGLQSVRVCVSSPSALSHGALSDSVGRWGQVQRSDSHPASSPALRPRPGTTGSSEETAHNNRRRVAVQEKALKRPADGGLGFALRRLSPPSLGEIKHSPLCALRGEKSPNCCAFGPLRSGKTHGPGDDRHAEALSSYPPPNPRTPERRLLCLCLSAAVTDTHQDPRPSPAPTPPDPPPTPLSSSNILHRSARIAVCPEGMVRASADVPGISDSGRPGYSREPG
ncbi:hypothetical protein AAFF_G00376450 [Aldrovandia affinis]|uniref:Uncharacterized protein n=1 Tax=Aldrovandia affinis TaxID=143900 RepID=A0AAD7SFS6_9TELE|nr:hypothetical protein AAFF_G00376450 [Aldrovandia affinis]